MSASSARPVGRRRRAVEEGMRLALTGASGTVGRSLVARLERRPEVRSVVALGRRLPPQGHGSAKLQLQLADLGQDGDGALERGVEGADVVVHLGFALYGLVPDEDRLFAVNVEGTQRVAEAAVAAGARRLVLASSAVVYGFRPDNPQPLTEDAPIRASARHFYARHKVEAERRVAEATAGADLDVHVLRPCAIVGPDVAGGALDGVPGPLVQGGRAALRGLSSIGLRPAIPGPPVPLQAVHEDDVAAAVELAMLGRGPAGAYNLAGDGVVDGSEVPALLGLRRAPVPRELVRRGAQALHGVATVWPAAGWTEAATHPLLLDTSKARQELGWQPRYSSRAALRATRSALGI